MSTLPPVPSWWPSIGGKCEPEVEQAHRLTFNAINDHQTAILALSAQVKMLQATTTASSTPAPATTTIITSTTTNNTVVAWGVNNQTGTSYTILNSDNQSLVTLNNAAPVSVSLSNSLTPGFIVAIENLGAGAVTITPVTGTINGTSSLMLGQNESCFLFFTGAAWWATTNVGSVTGVSSLNGLTGALTLVPGTGISIGPSGSSIDIASNGQVLHLTAAGGSITGTAQPQAGAGATVTVNGKDAAGSVTLTAGTRASPGNLVQVNFAAPYANAPAIVLTPANSATALIQQPYAVTGTNSFFISSPVNLIAATVYEWFYQIIGL